MIRALIWKEWRTHWPMLTLFLLLGFFAFFIPVKMATTLNWNWFGLDKLLVVAMVMAAWIHGQLLGALLTGDDREGGTAFYLDCLTANRKLRARLLLILSIIFQTPFILMLLLAGYFAGILTGEQPFILVLYFALGSFLGLGWGLAMGIRMPSVLAAFGLSAAIQSGAYLLVWGFFIFLNAFIKLDPEFATFLVFLLTIGLIIVPWVLAWLWFTDEQRARVSSLNMRERAVSWWKRGAWLCWPRVWKNFFWQAPLAILLGLVLNSSPLLWPAWSLFLGVFWGLIIIAPEQREGYRWWGMMRPPLLRFWGVPAALCFSSGIILLAMTLFFHLFFLIVTKGQVVGGWPGLGNLIPIGPWLVLWFAPGFASALFFSPWERKPIVSFIVAFAMGAILSLPWIPSLLAGRLGVFTVMAPSLILLAGGIAWVRPWVNGTLKSRETKIKAAAVFALAFLIPPAVLWSWASIQLPDSKSLGLEELKKQIALQVKSPEFLAAEARILRVQELAGDRNWKWIGHAARNGWKSMGKILGEERAKVKVEDKDKPPQLVEIVAQMESLRQRLHPENTPLKPVAMPVSFVQWGSHDSEGDFSLSFGTENLFEFETAWALYQAGQGNEQALVDTLAWQLSVARCFFHLSPNKFLFWGAMLERIPFRMVSLYIQDFKGKEETLEKLALVVKQHIAQMEKLPPSNFEGLGCLYALNSIDHPFTQIKRKMILNGMVTPNENMWLSLIAEAWQIPWEKKRFQYEVLEWFLHPEKRKVDNNGRYINEPMHFNPIWGNNQSFEFFSGFNREKHLLVVNGLAMRRYRLANGSWPADWKPLVGKYLEKIPIDPWDNEPLRFRVSNGEVHKRWHEPITLAPDTLVLWSVGKDLVDNHGAFYSVKDEELRPPTPWGPDGFHPLPLSLDELISRSREVIYYEKDIILIIPP